MGADAHTAGTDVRRLYAGLESRIVTMTLPSQAFPLGATPGPGGTNFAGASDVGSLRMANVREIQVHPSATTDTGRK